MNEHERFEANRPRLRAVAYRMLGSATEADDAVQEAWLRLDRAGSEHVDNLDAWLTTVVGRVCLDMLRSRGSRREGLLSEAEPTRTTGPEDEAVLADSVGLALLVVLETLTPAERLAFVLHDLFAVPFDEVAPIVGRSPDAARQLASRARRRVRGHSGPAGHPAGREIVDAFLTASREGDFATLLSLLDPDVLLRVDEQFRDLPTELRGAHDVARFYVGRAHGAFPALIDGALGIRVAPGGDTLLVVTFAITGGRITALEATTNQSHLRDMEILPL
ncbi:sigma-70 family RNA polymerase sigma factor [Paractinoplanes brasiliensis]|uniref:RNA polymerase sigma-70 factor (ECF subfamily) n=1 Tax=Paractinoplanes brasiliensis TaxID=52695 RepID=A0A4R6JQW8_9ACTN|nr:sigma-70 family RNA polymerase sigma factor [Actinoplanes brasiliensis]TDO38102.1 RNA polymerase sigma-70 factor (ECF subfamily) [Actinoplanes brasiliensis]GID31195.1 RNA polymerase sigma factor [Actinoplanes brasiliensis]